MEMNEILERLPQHLMDFVIDQPYNEYTAQDHAVWRYVMRQNVNYLSKVAHESYVDGLRQTGISIEEIPHMYGMNRILKKIGWAAVAVDGFIPPAAFMEFQAYNVLVIAADIRPIDQIEYTPAPDIIHEAAGHAPIIANYEYSLYLKRFGELGAKAFSSKRDYDLYEAIRHLSILKADPYTTETEIKLAERLVSQIEHDMGKPSEMAKLRNLHWWTVEYGLIGDLNNPKIYGAGLLSSIGESMSCLKDDVLKLPYSIEAVDYDFDITTKQPQLFVTPNFEHLNKVLDEFADCMALRKGGIDAINRAIESGNTATIVLSSGIQISGTFTDAIIVNNQPIFIRTNSPTTLNFQNIMIDGHSKEYHSNGYSTPIGHVKNISGKLENLSLGDLEANGIIEGKQVILEFESGITVKGVLRKITRIDGKNLILTFSECTVTYQNQVLFRPEWGIYDMAVGVSINSGFNGPADPLAFGLKYTAPKEKTHKIVHSEEAKILHSYYAKVRELRNSNKINGELNNIWKTVSDKYQNEWLLILELAEIANHNKDIALFNDIKSHLDELKIRKQEFAHLIDNGLSILNEF